MYRYFRTSLEVTQKSFEGKTVLLTAGPTQEPIDPVRFIGNHSTGKMGYALAEAARDRGARVTLVSTIDSLPVPYGVERVPVERWYSMTWSSHSRTATFRFRTPARESVRSVSSW